MWPTNLPPIIHVTTTTTTEVTKIEAPQQVPQKDFFQNFGRLGHSPIVSGLRQTAGPS